MFQIQTSFVSTRNLMMINCSDPNFCCSFLPGFRQKSSKILKDIVQFLCCTFAFMLRPHFMMPISNGKQWACLTLFPFLRKKEVSPFLCCRSAHSIAGLTKRQFRSNSSDDYKMVVWFIKRKNLKDTATFINQKEEVNRMTPMEMMSSFQIVHCVVI